MWYFAWYLHLACAVTAILTRMSFDDLLQPPRLWTRDQVLARPSPVPKEAGVYAWYFKAVPGPIDVSRCHTYDGLWMLYVGIAPKKPYADGRRSKSTLHARVRYHYRGNAEGSTLRLTLGCLLAQDLGIELRRVGSGKRRTFSQGEHELSGWMSMNAFVCWLPHPDPWTIEEHLIASYDVPLNLDQNTRNAFHPELRAVRKAAKQRAAQLPALPR